MDEQKKNLLVLTVTNSNSFNHNKLTKIFTSIQTNIFYTVVALCQLNKKLIMEPITFTEFMKLSNIKGTTKKDFKQWCEIIKQSTSITEKIGSTEITYNIFSAFAIDEENETISAKIAEDYRNCFSDFISEYTKFFLEEHNSLPSNPCKTLYRLLKQWKFIGKYEITIEEFEDLFLNIKENDEEKKIANRRYYKRNYIDKNIKILNDKKYFNNLKCTVKRSEDSRHAIIGFKFTFTPEKRLLDVDTKKEISGDAIYTSLGNQNLMKSEYDKLCSSFNKDIVNAVIKRIIDKPYMNCLSYEKIKEWCNEANEYAKKKSTKVNTIKLENSYYDNLTKEEWDDLEKLLISN